MTSGKTFWCLEKKEFQHNGLTANLAMKIVPCLPVCPPQRRVKFPLSLVIKNFFFFLLLFNLWFACCHIKTLKIIDFEERGDKLFAHSLDCEYQSGEYIVSLIYFCLSPHSPKLS